MARARTWHVVHWMLSHGRLDEALRLCIKSKSSLQNAASVVPGVDFFRAALAEMSSALKRKEESFQSPTLCRSSLSEDAKKRPWRQNKYEMKEITERPNKDLYMCEDERVALLNSLHAFLIKWDASLFTFQQSTGRSRLASMIEFPEGTFNEDNALMLKIKYGFVS